MKINKSCKFVWSRGCVPIILMLSLVLMGGCKGDPPPPTSTPTTTTTTTTTIMTSPLPPAPQCGDNRTDLIIDDFEEQPTPWTFWGSHNDIPKVTITQGKGCSGPLALVLNYDMGPFLENLAERGDWLVVFKNLNTPLDLRPYTHLRLAVRGTDKEAHHTLQIKLTDVKGTTYWVVAQSITDILVWRPMYVDLKEFTCFVSQTRCQSSSFDFSAINKIEFAISRCIRDKTECERGANQASFYLDEFAAVNLNPGSTHRVKQTAFEYVPPDLKMRSDTARALLNHQHTNGLCPAWFEETNPNYNTYAQALCLLVFVYEYETTGDTRYKNAANNLASKLLDIQISQGENAGAWHTAYTFSNGQIVPSEEFPWVGNTAWAVIGLARLNRAQIYPERTQLESAITQAAKWLANRMGTITLFPNLVTEGMEGNISTYFALRAAGRMKNASRLANGILTDGWDNVQKRMKMGSWPWDYGTAMDTSGSWGVQFLKCEGKQEDALLSQGFAATILSTTSFDDKLKGYGDIAGPWTVTVEFDAQAASAGIIGANQLMQEIHLLQAQDGSFPGSSDDWYGGTVAPWTTTMTGVAPTAWVYFVHARDPLMDLCPYR